MRIIAILTVLLLCSFQTIPASSKELSEAQSLVEQIVATHPGLVRLTISPFKVSFRRRPGVGEQLGG